MTENVNSTLPYDLGMTKFLLVNVTGKNNLDSDFRSGHYPTRLLRDFFSYKNKKLGNSSRFGANPRPLNGSSTIGGHGLRTF